MEVIIVSFLGFMPIFSFIVVYSFLKIREAKAENDRSKKANGIYGIMIFATALIASVLLIFLSKRI